MGRYKQLILKDETTKRAEEVDFIVEESSQQIQADILATKKQIASCKREVEAAKGSIPFSPKKVIEKQVELEGYEKGLEMLVSLSTELFSDADVDLDVIIP